MKLRARLRQNQILVAPGVFDPLSAILAQHHGCEAVFVSGAAVALTQLALPDVGLASATELVDVVTRIADRVTIPVFVDGDSGYGNAANLQRLVRGLCRAGASAVQIEDQVAIKPVTHVRGRPMVPVGEMVGKIKAAQDARTSDDFLISARTDAMTTQGLDEALARGEAYIEAGCDLFFVESVTQPDDITRIIANFGASVPLVHNLLEGGGSPFDRAHEAEAAGFSLALFPATALQSSAHAMGRAFAEITSSGTSAGSRETMTSLKDINAIIGTDEFAMHIAGYGEKA
ncbi:MAG: isocitrate lyase/PEP mutase family protein [Sphingomonadaceae bacterium]|nr:isocitrate lyase/PEP mutase family protein [Sphingomonadaceae bacterium]